MLSKHIQKGHNDWDRLSLVDLTITEKTSGLE